MEKRTTAIPDYCTQNDGDCETCSLVSYRRDCLSFPRGRGGKHRETEMKVKMGTKEQEGKGEITEITMEKTEERKKRKEIVGPIRKSSPSDKWLFERMRAEANINTTIIKLKQIAEFAGTLENERDGLLEIVANLEAIKNIWNRWTWSKTILEKIYTDY